MEQEDFSTGESQALYPVHQVSGAFLSEPDPFVPTVASKYHSAFDPGNKKTYKIKEATIILTGSLFGCKIYVDPSNKNYR
jgi:hypothetical protein